MNILLLSILTAPSQAAEFAITPTSDLQAIFDTVNPGDVVTLDDGNYAITSTVVLRELTGTEALPVVIQAAEGAAPVLRLSPNTDGAYPGRMMRIEASTFVELRGLSFEGDSDAASGDFTSGGLQIDASSDVTVADCAFRDLPGTAVYVSGDTNAVTFDHNEIDRLYQGHGIYVGCSDASCLSTGLTVYNNLIHDLVAEDVYGIALQPGVSGTLITDNVLYNMTDRGVDLGSTDGGEPHTFEGNALWNLGDHAVIIRGSVTMRNNIIFNTGGSGIVARDPERGFYEDIIISYNTVVDNDLWAADLGDFIEGSGHIVGNNAFCNPLSYGVTVEKQAPDGADLDDIPTPATMSTNYVCGLVENLSDEAGEVIAGGGYADFTDVDLWNFYPTRESLLVNAADPSGVYYPPDVDFNGVPREGDQPDVGAYEWDGDDNPGWALQEDFKDFELAEDEVAEAVESGCCNDDKSASEALLLLPFVGLGALTSRRRRRRLKADSEPSQPL